MGRANSRAVARLTSSGAAHPTFGSDGVTPIEGSANVPELQIDGLDQLAIGAGSIVGSNPDCRAGGAVYRLGWDGGRLAEFGSACVARFDADAPGCTRTLGRSDP